MEERRQLGSREFEGAFTRGVNDCASGSTFLTQCIVNNVAIIVALNECPALIGCHVVGRKTTNVQSLTLRVNGSLQFTYVTKETINLVPGVNVMSLREPGRLHSVHVMIPRGPGRISHD